MNIFRKLKSANYLCAIHFFRFFPINSQKIVFDNFGGRGYAGNTKYIADEIIRRKLSYEMLWIIDNKENCGDMPPQIKCIKKGSVRAAFHIETAGIWIDNIRKSNVVKRKNQLYIQAWHGLIGIKKVEGQVGENLPTRYLRDASMDSKAMDYLIAPCQRYAEIMKKFFWIDQKKVILSGATEFDALYDISEEKKEKYREKLGLQGKKMLLYAPTFRIDPNYDYFDIDFKLVLDALVRRFGGDWCVGIRLHPNVKVTDYSRINCPFIDLSNYEDCQELIMITDALITDYSSVIFNSSIIHIPSFIHAIDIEQYRRERDYEIPLEELPFAVSCNNQQLIENINSYSEKEANEKYDRFFEKIGVVFDGMASKRVCELIQNYKSKN